MKKDIPLKIEIFSSGEDDKHRLTSAKEIEFVLRCIAEKGTRVALYYGDANDFILTTLLDADNKGLWLEQSPNNQDNRRIAESNKLVFVSSHLQVKVQFTTHQISAVVHQGYPAFYLPLPGSLYRLQRREYYRLTAPIAHPLRCTIPVKLADGRKTIIETTVIDRFSLKDIASTPAEYQRLKKRRQRALAAIREALTSITIHKNIYI